MRLVLMNLVADRLKIVHLVAALKRVPKVVQVRIGGTLQVAGHRRHPLVACVLIMGVAGVLAR